MNAQAATDLALLWAVDPAEVKRVRKKDGLVAVYDVLQWITQQEANACRKTWQRVLEAHPELAAICRLKTFNTKGRGGNRETPGVDAKGVVQLLMALPGPAAVQFRLQAADVLVRYLGGDETLAAEAWRNRLAQESLAKERPDHPARVFGEAVESASGSAPSEDMACLQRRLLNAQIEAAQAQARRHDAESKHLRLQNVAQACQFCERQGLFMDSGYETLAREAVNAAVL